MEMKPWKKIKQEYKDQWVAMTEWEEDEHGDVTKGYVAYTNPSQNAFYEYLKGHFPKKDLAVRFTGKVRVPLLFGTAIEEA